MEMRRSAENAHAQVHGVVANSRVSLWLQTTAEGTPELLVKLNLK